MEIVLVTRKGQVTIPVAYRRKYGIREGTRMLVRDGPSGIVLTPILGLEDLAGADIGRYGAGEMKRALDEMRKRWR